MPNENNNHPSSQNEHTGFLGEALDKWYAANRAMGQAVGSVLPDSLIDAYQKLAQAQTDAMPLPDSLKKLNQSLIDGLEDAQSEGHGLPESTKTNEKSAEASR